MKPVELQIIMRNQTKEGLRAIDKDLNAVNGTVSRINDNIKNRIKDQQEVVKRVENDIKSLQKQLDRAAPGKAKQGVLLDLNAAKKALEEEKAALSEVSAQVDFTTQKHETLRSQITRLKNDMSGMTEGTDEYNSALQRLGDLQDRYGDINRQGQIFSDDNKNIRAAAETLSGLTGVITAATGAASLFGMEEEKLAEIQTRLQSLMAITIGLQQVANMLNKDSYFSHVLLVKIKGSWANAQKLLNTQLGISIGLSKALMASGIGLLIVGVSALTSKYKSYREEQEKVNNAKKEALDIEKEIVKSVSTESTKAKALLAIAENQNASLSMRKDAIQRLNKLMPDYNGYLDKEGTLIANTDVAMKNYLDTLYKVEKAKKLMAKVSDIEIEIDSIVNAGPEVPTNWDVFESKIANIFSPGRGDNLMQQVFDKNKAVMDQEINKLNELKGRLENSLQSLLSDDKVFKAIFGENTKSNQSTKSEKDLAGELLRLREKNEQTRINLMEESTNKRLAQIKHDYDREIALVNEKEKELRKAQNGNLTGDQSAELDIARKNAAAARSKSEDQVRKEEKENLQKNIDAQVSALIEYTKEYGTYQEKRLAITREYAAKIAKAQTIGEKLSLGKEREKAYKELDRSMLKQSDLWVNLFEDASKQTNGFVRQIIKDTQQLLDYIEGKEGVTIPIGMDEDTVKALKDDPEKVKAILDGLIKKRDAMNKRNPFDQLITGFKGLKAASGDVNKEFTALGEILQGLNGVASIIGEIGTALDNAGSSAGKTLNDISEIVGQTSSMASTGASIGGAWGAAVGGALGLSTSLLSVFGGAKELSQAAIDSYNAYIAAIDDLIAKQKELLQSSAGTTATGISQEMLDQVEKQMEATRNIGKKYMDSGGGVFSHSHGYKQNKVLKAYREELQGIGIDIEKIGGAKGLFDLELNEIERIKTDLPELWSKLDESTRTYLQNLIDSGEQLDEIREQLDEAYTGMTFDALKSSLDDLVKSADLAFTDIEASFEDHMSKAILNFVKNELMQEELKAWYANFSKAMSNGVLTPKEAENLKKEYADIIQKGNEAYQNAMKEAGIDVSGEGSTQTGKSGAFMTMTQEQGTKLEGLFTSVQGHVSNMDEKMTDISTVLASIYEQMGEIVENTEYCKYLEEIKDSIDVLVRDGIKTV